MVRVLGLYVKGGVLNYGLLDGQSGHHGSLTADVNPQQLARPKALYGHLHIALEHLSLSAPAR
jgi:hypothetical protein